ncbi:MAG: transcription termination factor NusA, partial [Patescibacteria group bacterium]|nr:transcription termination factor NusA [Patescibacteria group bacterium]
KLCGWDIEIMTREELDEQIEQAVGGYASIEGVSDELAERLVGEGFLSYDDLSIIEPDDLMEMGGLTEEQVAGIVKQAETKAEDAERQANEQRRRQREQDRHAATESTESVEATEAEDSGGATDADAAESEAMDEAMDEATDGADAPMGDQVEGDLEEGDLEEGDQVEGDLETVSDGEAGLEAAHADTESAADAIDTEAETDRPSPETSSSDG